MKKYVCCIAIIIILFGCNTEKKDYATDNSGESMDVVADSAFRDTTATPKIIKTADMRFRVDDVQKAKEKITSILKAQGGTVAEFDIQSIVQETDKVQYSIDSLKEITAYRKEGMMVAKVPSAQLDDFTNTIAKMAVFVDQQAMKMDDQILVYLTNRMKSQNRVEALKAINQTAKRKGNNVETSLYIKDDNVDKKIENMAIDDKVKFSTITLNFYQSNTVHTLIVANDHISDYGPGFFQKLGLNLLAGWSFLKVFILGAVTLWPFIAILMVVFFVVRHFAKVNRLKSEAATKHLINNPNL